MPSKTGNPSAFISYAWEGNEHREWVRALATELYEDGVDVRLDIWDLAPGARLPHYMEREVRENDFVLCICTPAYAEKSNARRGGVGYEGNIMTAELATHGNEEKFVPVLRKGDMDGFPSWLLGKLAIDLSGDPYAEPQYEMLLNHLFGRGPRRPERKRGRRTARPAGHANAEAEESRREGITYPPLRFLPDHGGEVWVTDPVQMATLLEDNPAHGRAFLYGAFIWDREYGWGGVDGGLSAALKSLVEDRYPNDRDAGLVAAVYRLDPARPYRAGTATFGSFAGLAEHLAAEADAYLPVLRNPNHALWIYLAARVDAQAGREMRAFAAALAGTEETDRAVQAVVFHRLVPRLRRLDGDPRLPFAGGLLSDPGELLARLPADQARAAEALADPASLLSVWVDETAPGLAHSLSTWRRETPGNAATLSYALGRGVSVGPGEIRTAGDALTGELETVSALWNGDAGVLSHVGAYLATYQDASLPLAAFEWLRDGNPGPHRFAVARYVAGRAADVAGSLAATSEGPFDAAARIQALAASFTGEPDAAWERALRPLIAQEPWRVMLRTVLPVVFRALAGEDAASEAGRRQVVARTLVQPAAEVLKAASDRVPSRLLRLGLWLRESARALEGAPTPAEAALWRAFLRGMDSAIANTHSQAYQDARSSSAQDVAARVVAAALAQLDAAGVHLAFHDRHASEERAYARRAAAIHSEMEPQREAAAAAADAAEVQALAAWRRESRRADAVRPLARAETGSWIALISLGAGLVFSGCLLGSLFLQGVRWAGVYRSLYPDEPRGALEAYANLFLAADGDPPMRLVLGVAAVALLWLNGRAVRARRRAVEQAAGAFPSGQARARAEQEVRRREALRLSRERFFIAVSLDPDQHRDPPPAAPAPRVSRATALRASLRPRLLPPARTFVRRAALTLPLWAPPAALYASQGRLDAYVVVVGVPEDNVGGAERLNTFASGVSGLPRSEGTGLVVFGPFAGGRARDVGRELTRASLEKADGEFYVIVTPESQRARAGQGYFQHRHCGCR